MTTKSKVLPKLKDKSVPSSTKLTTKDGSAAFLCKYCGTVNEEEFCNMKSLCERCRGIVKAVKIKEKDREKRNGIIRNIMLEFKTLDERDEIAYSEVPTGTLLDIAKDYKDMKVSITNHEKIIEKLKREIDKLKSR